MGVCICIYIYIKIGICIYMHTLLVGHIWLFFSLYNNTCIIQTVAEQELKAFTDSNKNDLCSRIRKAIFDFVLLFF